MIIVRTDEQILVVLEKNYVKEYATIKVLSHMKTYLKYGSWSMAQGMRQGTFLLSPKMKGKDEEKEGAA